MMSQNFIVPFLVVFFKDYVNLWMNVYGIENCKIKIALYLLINTNLINKYNLIKALFGLQVPSENDGCALVKLDFYFTYFDTIYKEISISTNGYICFGNNEFCKGSIRPSLSDILVTLNYDLDTTRIGSGQIYYKNLKEDSNEFILAKIYLNLFNPLFEPTNILMVTYDEVLSSDKALFSKVSFQVFLATDSRKSFVVYKYKSCPSELTLKASSGFTHKKNTDLIVIENGQQCSSSNVGQTGIWVVDVTRYATGNFCNFFFEYRYYSAPFCFCVMAKQLKGKGIF
jgi:hypothetical protein